MQTQLPVLIRALHDPARYPHPTRGVELIETHISWVLLTGPYAYKIKKPVDLGFLDFTTLALRRHYCEEELRLNRRFAAALYLDVVAITGNANAPCISSASTEGEAIEYAVKMIQFEPEMRFDRLLSAGKLSTALLERLAEILAARHTEARRAESDEGYGTPEAIDAPARANFAHITLPPSFTTERHMLAELAQWSETTHTRLTPRFMQRLDDGFVRACHGDLHLANITLYGDEPTPFDCLEFDPALSTIDVMNEIAFLLMDLDRHHCCDLGLRFLNEYLHHSGDYEGLEVLRFYQVYRAMVRAKVESIRLSQISAATDTEKYAGEDKVWSDLRGYIRLAHAYTRKAPVALLVTHGLSGSGKTTLSRELLAPCGLVRVRSDVERKRLAGFRPEERTGSATGGGVYTASASARTYQRLEDIASMIIAAGFPALVDATFLQRAQRDNFRALAAKLGVPFLLLDFHAEEALLRARLQARKAGSDASEAGNAVLDQQLRTQETLAPDELARALHIDAGAEIDYAALIATIRARIER
ncbi:MAG: AAA family ATPase [Chromatiales bacterium]|jgi:aminoglycoside phosphotransferase family enzyme/predicted kinase|nr:AAA family ATPase [Chromatiales bacterium]